MGNIGYAGKKGEVGILSVGAGDTKLSFDKSNPAERIRAARIVKDMLRRGYALLVEVDDGKGGKVFRRAKDFDEDVCEYIIADFDPVEAAEHDAQESESAEVEGKSKATEVSQGPPPAKRARTKRVDAESTRSVAVARTSGG